MKKLYAESTAVEVAKDVHQARPAYGGKTLQNKSWNMQKIFMMRLKEILTHYEKYDRKGYDSKLVEDARNKIKIRNKQNGI